MLCENQIGKQIQSRSNMIFQLVIYLLSCTLLISPSWADQNLVSLSCAIQNQKEKLYQIASSLNRLDCLSPDIEAVRENEYYLLEFLAVLQDYALEENRTAHSTYELWFRGELFAYYTVDSVEYKTDTYVIRISPSDDKRVSFTPFLVNPHIESEVYSLLLEHPAGLFARDFLKEYCEGVPCSPSAFQEYTEKIQSTTDARKQLLCLRDMLEAVVQELQKTINNKEIIVDCGVLSYFVEITVTGAEVWRISPKRPKVLNFQDFDINVDESLPMMLHSYGLELPREGAPRSYD